MILRYDWTLDTRTTEHWRFSGLPEPPDTSLGYHMYYDRYLLRLLRYRFLLSLLIPIPYLGCRVSVLAVLLFSDTLTSRFPDWFRVFMGSRVSDPAYLRFFDTLHLPQGIGSRRVTLFRYSGCHWQGQDRREPAVQARPISLKIPEIKTIGRACLWGASPIIRFDHNYLIINVDHHISILSRIPVSFASTIP